MQKNLIKILTFANAIIVGINCFSQTDYNIENLRRIDTYVKAPVCQGIITYPTKYKLSKVKSDLIFVPFINLVSDNKLTIDNLNSELKNLETKKYSITESLNGLIKAKRIILKGNYLRANIVLEFIEKTVVRRSIILTTTTHASCNVYNYRLFDFNVARRYFLKDLKLFLDINLEEMTADTIYSNNLAALAIQRKDYRFSIPGSSSEKWINEIFEGQYNSGNNSSYGYYRVPEYIKRLIKENRITVINDLLYSPNYLVSINAMEALQYLSYLGKFTPSTEDIERLTQIKSASIIFYQADSDVYREKHGYKDLKMTDESVIKKYTSAM